MATELENLKTRRAAIATEIAEVAPRKPSYSVDGRSVSWTEYRRALLEEYNTLNDLIILLEPAEYSIQGTP